MKKRLTFYNYIILPCVLCCGLLVFLLTFSVNVKASDSYFPMYQDDNDFYSQPVIDTINYLADSENKNQKL